MVLSTIRLREMSWYLHYCQIVFVLGHRLVRLCIDNLVQDAIEAHKTGGVKNEMEVCDEYQAES